MQTQDTHANKLTWAPKLTTGCFSANSSLRLDTCQHKVCACVSSSTNTQAICSAALWHWPQLSEQLHKSYNNSWSVSCNTKHWLPGHSVQLKNKQNTVCISGSFHLRELTCMHCVYLWQFSLARAYMYALCVSLAVFTCESLHVCTVCISGSFHLRELTCMHCVYLWQFSLVRAYMYALCVSLAVFTCESLHVCTVCIWLCEHAKFCVEVLYALYVNLHSSVHLFILSLPLFCPTSAPRL